MHATHTKTFLCALAIGVSSIQCAVAEEVWVVTDHAHPLRAVEGARIIYLDDPILLKSELGADLPNDAASAADIVKERLTRGGRDLQRRLALAYQGVADAWRLHIEKIPAVVVDQRYVVYGVTDASDAVARVRAYRSAHP